MQTFTASPRLLQCSGGMLRLAVLRLNLVADRLLRYSTTAMARTRLALEIRSGDCRPRERRARRATAKDDFADLTSGSVITASYPSITACNATEHRVDLSRDQICEQP